MKRFIAAILGAGLLVLSALITSTAQAAPADNIVLSLPESVLAQAIAAVTPFSFNSASNMIQGTITVRGVHNLRLGNNNLRARLDLAGSNLEVVTELAGQRLRMKVGEVALAADMLAELHFDGKRQILYVKPVVDESQNVGGNEVGRGLIALLNGREFPLTMRDIEPFVAEVGGKTINIATKVTDVRALPKKLELSLAPQITRRAGR